MASFILVFPAMPSNAISICAIGSSGGPEEVDAPGAELEQALKIIAAPMIMVPVRIVFMVSCTLVSVLSSTLLTTFTDRRGEEFLLYEGWVGDNSVYPLSAQSFISSHESVPDECI